MLGSAVAVVLLTACAAGSTGSAASTSAAASSPAAQGAAPTSGSVTAPPSGPDALVGTTFVASEVTGSRSIAPGSMISVTFVDDKQLSATAGCNTMNGAYTLTGDTLSAPVLASTRMACIDPVVSDQETWFATFLASSPTVSYSGGTLTLTDGTDTVVFAGAPSGADALVDTGWKVTDLISVSGSTVAAVDSTLTAWVRFSAGEVVFNNSCNGGGGTAEIGDSTITFGPLRSTLIFCDGPSGELEAVMNAVLQGVTPYTVTTDPGGTRLTIMSADGVTGLGFLADPTVGADAFPATSSMATSGMATSSPATSGG